ncbi:MAG TPA: PP2C family serine/threonine-protein phosphatase, partial [bacterium]|nr:PP2C family serine/threonine-protein phosphatase [bacterium]
KLNELIEVTEKLLPQRREIIFSDYSVSGYIQQSREIGGDFYDLIEITENKYICVIADVVGKSFPAAYLMTLAINSIRLLCKQYDNNTSFLSALNDYIKNYTPSGKWFTMIFSVIDLLDNKIEIINCGHPSAFFYKTNNTIEISSQLPMIGQFSSEKFNKYLAEYSQNQCIHNFEKNNILIIYTDGLSDLVQNNNCNIKTLFHEFCDNNDFKKNADNFLNFIKTKLHNFDIKDDLTFCIITRH